LKKKISDIKAMYDKKLEAEKNEAKAKVID